MYFIRTQQNLYNKQLCCSLIQIKFPEIILKQFGIINVREVILADLTNFLHPSERDVHYNLR